MEAAWAAELRAGSYQFTAALRDGTASSRVRGSAIVAPTVEKNAISLTVKAGANVARLILVDSVGYANLGPATGGGYVRLDPSQPGPGREIFGSTVRGFDKDASLEAFTCALQDFRELGDDTVDGVETTHYRVFVDSSEVRPFQDFGLKPGEAPEVASFDVWLDGGGRTRRMAYDVAGSSATTTNTGFGKPVDISAPPRSQITSGTSTTSS